MNIFTIFQNYPLISAVSAWAVAQILKVIIKFAVTGQFDTERLFGAGGMPSAHSATVCALVIAVSRVDGLNSPQFAIVVIFAFVVMYDAMGVRRAAGEQAKRINLILSKLKDNNGKDDITVSDELITELQVKAEITKEFIEEMDEDDDPFPDKELKEFIGHTPLEVLGGALLGIIIAMVIRF